MQTAFDSFETGPVFENMQTKMEEEDFEGAFLELLANTDKSENRSEEKW